MDSLRPSEACSRPNRLSIDGRIRWTEALMRHNVHRKLRLQDLAQATALSASRLCHLFKSETGTPPARYLRLMRLRNAADLLKNTALSVKEVAGRLGFDDVSRFVEQFRKAYGLTPSRYRREFWRSERSQPPSRRSSRVGT